MDYCKDGDLKKYLRKKEKLSEGEAFSVMKQIITGYQELAK
jgi:serine/threonine protein kinase